MNTRRLGSSGLHISQLSLGTMNFGSVTDRSESFRIIDTAIDAGINCIDCADIYNGGESERILGEYFFRNPEKRNKIILTTKVFNPTGPNINDRGNTRYHLRKAVEKSLRQLKTDHIDIYFLHRTDINVPQEDTWLTMDMLVREGKISYPAVSTHPSWRTVEALDITKRYGYARPVCEQLPYNILDRRAENELLPMCGEKDLGVFTWSPLAHGVLANKYTSGVKLPAGSRGSQRSVFAERITDEGIAIAEKVNWYCKEKGTDPTLFVIAWVLSQQPVTSVIAGPRTEKQLKNLIPASEMIIDDRDRELIDSLVPPGGFTANFFNTSGWMKESATPRYFQNGG
ncbi:MAG: aldo/keto reductase [Spirochaetia bacterium]|nr:aldo/keto reductase [Spirochaetia bacterium]MCF7946139.1 aldo/keto reductase [Spirochaetia bacterium]